MIFWSIGKLLRWDFPFQIFSLFYVCHSACSDIRWQHWVPCFAFHLLWDRISLALEQHKPGYPAHGLLGTLLALPPASWCTSWIQTCITTSGIHMSCGSPNLCPHIRVPSSFTYWIILSCCFNWFYSQLLHSVYSPFWVICVLQLISVQCGFPVVTALIV